MKICKKKFKSFNCNVIKVDGHNIHEIKKSFNKKKNKKPTIIIANTIKGKGVNFMENKILWHYKSPNQEQYLKSFDQLQ